MIRTCMLVPAIAIVCSLGCGRGAAPPADPVAPVAQPGAAASIDEASTADSSSDMTPTNGAPLATPATGFETPEAAFAALQGALAERDWRKGATCLTPESQELMTTGLLLAGGLMAAFGGDETSGIAAVMQKHGIEMPEPQFSFSVGETPPGDAEEPDAEMSDAEMPDIQDRPGFIADMMAELEKLNQPGADQQLQRWTAGGLQDLVIEGDSATAMLAFEGVPAEEIAFRREAAGWLVHLPEEAFGMGAESGGLPSGSRERMPSEPLAEVELQDGLSSTLDLTFERPFESQFFGQEFPERTLFVTLQLTGEPVLNTYEYGEFQIVSATDDTGAALELAAPIKDQFSSEFGEQFIELNDFFLDEADTLPLLFALTPPAEGATMVTLEARIKLKVRESIVIENVMESLGGELQDERLAELGKFVVKQQDADNGDPEHGLLIEFTGTAGTVEEMKLLDGEGQPLKSAGKFSFGFGGQKSFGLSTDQKLPADTQLRITLGGNESIQVVPLKFEDVALP